MKYFVNNSVDKKGEPAYISLYRQVREDIVGGVYRYNGRLPSKRIMAEETGTSTVTVEHAYALLCDEGYIEPRERSGYFVIFRYADGFASAAPDSVPVKTFPENRHIASDHEFPFSVLTKTMRRVISDYGESILDRSPNKGCLELRGAIAGYLERSKGIKADIGQILIGSGSEYLYSMIVALAGRDKRFAIESPSYNKINQVYSAAGINPELLPLGSDGIDSRALGECTADILHISPYRSYPSGVSANASKRHEYVRWASAGERYIIEDDFESEFSVSKKPEETVFSISENDNVIYMNTFSKTISPSLRVGYMVLPRKLIGLFEDRVGFFSCTVPTYIQFILAELITNGDFERHINRVRRQKRRISKK
ncbi:MAG: PLP-dependent aminotransferase family protein [Clostridia bacterium]|nr:PLP-dependent aminotransferase family protein [Clostridia bacterium]